MVAQLPWGLGDTASGGAGVGGPAGPSPLLEDPCKFAPNTFLPWGLLPPETALWRLVDCEDADNKLFTNTDLSLYVGKVVKIDGKNESWIVQSHNDFAPKDPVDVVVLQVFDDCGASEGQIPEICPCWPPPCENLVQQYRMEGEWATRGSSFGGSCAYNNLDVVLTFELGQNCCWVNSTENIIGFADYIQLCHVVSAQTEWRISIQHTGLPSAADLKLTKSVGATPVGAYTPERTCEAGTLTSSIHVRNCVVSEV